MTIAAPDLDTASRIMLNAGVRVLQGARLGPGELGHVQKLLEHMAPEANEHWLDIGCGFGEPARLMLQIRPDLRFTLINNNPFQLDQVPRELPHHLADMHALPFVPHMFDGAMFLWSLCHAQSVVAALTEAARMVRPGGHLFVYDMARFIGDNRFVAEVLDAEFPAADELEEIGYVSGWHTEMLRFPSCAEFSVFRAACADQTEFDELLHGLVPVIWRARRMP